MICDLPPKKPVLCSPARRTNIVMNLLKWAKEAMLAYDRLYSFPSKCFIPIISAFAGQRTKLVTKSIPKRETCLSSPPHISLQGFMQKTIRLEIRSISPYHRTHYLLVHGVWAWQTCTTLINVHRTGWGLFRGTMFLGFPVTTKPSGRADCVSDTFSLQGEGKGHQWTSASGAADGMGYGGVNLTGRGRRGCLAFESFCTPFCFLSCWVEGEKRKEVPYSHRPCYAPQQAPCQGRFPLALKRFRCLPLHYEVFPWDLKGCRLLQLFRRTSSMEGQRSLPSQTPHTL